MRVHLGEGRDFVFTWRVSSPVPSIIRPRGRELSRRGERTVVRVRTDPQVFTIRRRAGPRYYGGAHQSLFAAPEKCP